MVPGGTDFSVGSSISVQWGDTYRTYTYSNTDDPGSYSEHDSGNSGSSSSGSGSSGSGSGGGSSKPTKPEKPTESEPIVVPVEPEPAEPVEEPVDELTVQIVDMLMNSMAANGITLETMEVTSADQLLFMALAPMAAGPTYPTTLPGILDYDRNGRLTVADLDYIMSYLSVTTVRHCYRDNNTDRRRSKPADWPASEQPVPWPLT